MIGFGMTSVAKGPLTGNGVIAGTAPGLVTVAGAPAARRVLVFDAATNRLAARVGSNGDGTYRIDRLNGRRRYTVIAFDHQSVYNAVIRDNITPAVNE